MAEQTDANTSKSKSSKGGISIRSYLTACLHNWYWFVLSVLIFGCIAYLYGKSQPQLYSSSALVLIKTNMNDASGEAQVLSDLSSSRKYRSLTNEIYVIKSTTIMDEVVSKLNLNVNYYYHKYLRDVNIYNSTPVIITPLKEVTKPFTVVMRPRNNNELDFRIVGGTDGRWKRARYGSKVNSEFGPIAINKSECFDDGYYGEEMFATVSTVHSMAQGLVGGLNIVKDQKDANVLRMTLTTSNKQLSVAALNALIAAYNQYTIDDKNRVARNTESFIVDRINALSKDLGGIDSQIEHLKIINRYPTIESAASAYTERSNTSQNDLAAVDVQISLVSYIKDYISRASIHELIPSNSGISDIGINGLIEQYNQLCLNYQRLAATTGSENPVMLDLDKQLRTLRANLNRSIDGFLSTLRIKQNQARSQERKANSMMSTVPTQEKEITDITRQQKIKEQLYLYLLNKREENALQVAVTEPNAKVLEPAMSGWLISPMENKIVAMGLLIGFCLPAAVIFLIFWVYSLDTLIHSRYDVENNCAIPLLGEIPSKRRDQQDVELVVSETGTDRITEAFRIIRGNLDYVLPPKENGEGNVIQFTSTMPGEGKSFNAANLAITCAINGKRVIAVDFDMRKGTFSKYFNIDNISQGVSAYLSGRLDDVSKIIYHTDTSENLDVLPLGAIPPNPTSLLMSDRLATLIDILKKQYDYIILDTVPYALIADGALINRYVDLTIYVIRDAKVDKRYLDDLEKMYKSNKIKNLTILLGDVKADAKRYAYGYGYGYGNEEDGKKHRRRFRRHRS